MYTIRQGIIDNDKLLKANQYQILWDLSMYAETAIVNWKNCGLVEKQFYLAQLLTLLSRVMWLVADKEIT